MHTHWLACLFTCMQQSSTMSRWMRRDQLLTNNASQIKWLEAGYHRSRPSSLESKVYSSTRKGCMNNMVSIRFKTHCSGVVASWAAAFCKLQIKTKHQHTVSITYRGHGLSTLPVADMMPSKRMQLINYLNSLAYCCLFFIVDCKFTLLTHSQSF